MKTFITLLKNELKMSIRGMDMLIFAVIMPLVVLVILGVVFGTKPAYDGAGYSFLGNIGIFFAGYLLVMISVFSIGMMVGGISKDSKIAGVIASILYFPMLIFSGATLPYEVMPEGMQKIADILPLTQGIKILKNATLGLPTGNVAGAVLFMTLIAVICSAVSIKFFRWE